MEEAAGERRGGCGPQPIKVGGRSRMPRSTRSTNSATLPAQPQILFPSLAGPTFSLLGLCAQQQRRKNGNLTGGFLPSRSGLGRERRGLGAITPPPRRRLAPLRGAETLAAAAGGCGWFVGRSRAVFLCIWSRNVDLYSPKRSPRNRILAGQSKSDSSGSFSPALFLAAVCFFFRGRQKLLHSPAAA